MADALQTIAAATGAVASALAAAFKEPEPAVRRALDAAVAGALGSLVAKSRTDEGLAEIRAALGDAQVQPALLADLPARLDGVRLRGRAGGAGMRLLAERGPALAEQLVGLAGVKRSTADALVDLATPLALAAINRLAPKAPDDARLRAVLSAQEAAVARAVPTEMQPFIGVSGARATPVAAPIDRRLIWAAAAVIVLLLIVLVFVLGGFGHAHAASLNFAIIPAIQGKWPAVRDRRAPIQVCHPGPPARADPGPRAEGATVALGPGSPLRSGRDDSGRKLC